MFIRAYLRASTVEQDALRAQAALAAFVADRGMKIAARYVENISGAKADRPELARLINDAHAGDVLLVESVDRLSRLRQGEWDALRAQIKAKGLLIVVVDLPTSHAALGAATADEFTRRMLAAINDMLLDLVAAMARKDYELRRARQAQGIAKAREAGLYRGRPADEALHVKVRELHAAGLSLRKIASISGCALSTVQRVLAA